MSALASTNEEDRFQDVENEEGLLAPSGLMAAEDLEADAIYSRIERKMEERRKSRKVDTSHGDKDEVKISSLFTDLKRDLMRVSEGEWQKLPEVGSFTAKRMKKTNSQKERYTPIPDSVIMGGMSGGYSSKIVSEDQDGGATDLRAISEARERILKVRLDQTISWPSCFKFSSTLIGKTP